MPLLRTKTESVAYKSTPQPVTLSTASGADDAVDVSRRQAGVVDELLALLPVSYTHLTLPTIYSV